MERAMATHPSRKTFFAGILGNIFEHYDQALFGLLAPFIAPLFFPEQSPISALMLTYSTMILGIFTKPLGALIFGFIGDRYGRKSALYMTLMGMSIVTCLMGLLPTFSKAGYWAPILLCLCRCLQSFFIAGESTGGAILVLENSGEKSRSFLNSLYNSSTILGIFIASAVVMMISGYQEVFAPFWRIPFFLGSICGLCGVFLRLYAEESVEAPSRATMKVHLKELFAHRRHLLPIVLASGFSYCTYLFSFTFMNGYLPFVSTLSKRQACKMNTSLLLLDFLLLPVFGYLAGRLSKERVMGISALLVAILAIPLFTLLDRGGWGAAFFVRTVIMTLGVGFAATYHHWAMEQMPQKVRYTIMATGAAFGAKLIGLPSNVIGLWLYQKTEWVAAPALYLVVMGSLATIVVFPMLSWRVSKQH